MRSTAGFFFGRQVNIGTWLGKKIVLAAKIFLSSFSFSIWDEVEEEWRHDTQPTDIQHYDTKHTDNQHTDNQHNDIQHTNIHINVT
jgi:hypothetical protein